MLNCVKVVMIEISWRYIRLTVLPFLIFSKFISFSEKVDRQDADDICNTFGRQGIHFLKDLFYKNQR